ARGAGVGARVRPPTSPREPVGESHERAAAAAGERGIAYVGIDAWHDDPAWLDAQGERVRSALGALPAKTTVVFTAHSLPERVLADDDPYPDQLRQSAAAIAERAGAESGGGGRGRGGAGLASDGWALAWQSAGRTPEPWRGPDVRGVIRDLAATGTIEGVLVCPQ